jgi:hypothetical protein
MTNREAFRGVLALWAGLAVACAVTAVCVVAHWLLGEIGGALFAVAFLSVQFFGGTRLLDWWFFERGRT